MLFYYLLKAEANSERVETHYLEKVGQPVKLKTIEVDGKTYAEVVDNKPVYLHDDGKEVDLLHQDKQKLESLNHPNSTFQFRQACQQRIHDIDKNINNIQHSIKRYARP